MKSTSLWRTRFFSIGLIVFLALFIAACSGGGDSSGGNHNPGTAPEITSAAGTTFYEGAAGTFTFTATGDPAPAFALTGTLPSGVTFDEATGTLSGTPAAGTSGTYPLTVTAGNGVSPDATQSFTLTVSDVSAFNTSSMPYAVPGSNYNGFGAFAFDAAGNLLYGVNSADAIRSINRITGAETTIATAVSGGQTLLGIAYANGYIYIGTSGNQIYKVNQSTGASTLLVSLTEDVNGLDIAPAGFGSYGGQLIAATYDGHVYAIDISQASPTPIDIANVGVSLSALKFGSNGTLYVACCNDGKIMTVTSAGTSSDFVTGVGSPDGLAINDAGGLLYVANSGGSTIYSVTIPGGVISTVASSISIDGGYWPTPIIYDAAGNLLLVGITSGSGMAITYVSL